VGVKLAPFTGVHDLVGVGDRGGPIKASVERIAHEGVRRCMVATHACVDVSNKFATMGMGMHRCRTRDTAMRLASDRSEGSSPRSIHARYLARQSSARGGGGSVSMASASFAPYPSSRESTNASFEGSSSMGFAPSGFEGAPEGSS
jgi:hypothetical protein